MQKILSIVILVALTLCESVYAQEVPPQLKSRYENLHAPSSSKAKIQVTASDTLSVFDLLEVGDSFNDALKNSYGVNLDLLADLVTSTNTTRDYWRNAREPRESILNGSSLTSELYKYFVQAQVDANNLYTLIKDSSKTVFLDGKDITASSEASVLMLRGISKAYLGLLFDQGVTVDSLGFLEGVSFENLESNLISYKALIEKGVSDIEEAINLATAISEEDFYWEALPAPSKITKARFLKMAHSMIAKILISAPRSGEETVDYSLVLDHARKGLDNEYPNIIFKTTIIENPPNISPKYKALIADFYNDWANFSTGCSNNSITNCSGFVPTDVKVMHLLDSTYSTSYPNDNASQLDYRQANTNDPRISYFSYTQNPGFLSATRDPSLLSNYFSIRGYSDNDWWNESNPVIYMTRAELQYIIAEAEAALGNFIEANEAMQNSPYGTISADYEIDLPSVQNGFLVANGFSFNGPQLSTDFSSFVDALHKEYSVELASFSTIGTQLFFMRRHGLLQHYTATQLPVPQEVLETKALEVYTFGGLENSGQVGTADGTNAWKENNLLSKPFGLKAEIRNREVEISWDFYPNEISGYRLTSDLIGYNQTFPSGVTSVIIDSLTNETTYTFKLNVFKDSQESETIEIAVMPTIFGGNNSFKFDAQETFVNQTNTKVVNLKNFLDIPLVIDSVKMVSRYENPEDPEHELNKYFYQDWREFFSLSHSEAVIQPAESIDFVITFEPELWGVHPLTHIAFYTNDGVFKLLHAPFNGEGGFVLAYYEEDEDYSYYNSFFNLPDSVNFGEVEIGKRDSTMLTFKNNSTGTFFVRSFYSTRIILENNIVVQETDGFPVFSFSEVQDTIMIPPKDSLNFWVYAEPLEEERYIARPRALGPELKNSISTHHGFLWGNLTVTGIKGEPVNNEREETEALIYQLSRNYPNPFNPTTNIEFSIPEVSDVKLTVFNVLGQRVTTLIDKKMNIGKHSITFNASGFSSGIYFYRLEAGGYVKTQKMLLVK